MNKKGFTLVELLAVVGILTVLILIAIPNAISAYNNSKKKNFLTDVQTVYKTAIAQNEADHYGKRIDGVYARLDGEPVEGAESLELTGSTKMSYYIRVSFDGVVQEFFASDGEFQYYFANPINDVNMITEDNIKYFKDLESGEVIKADEFINSRCRK